MRFSSPDKNNSILYLWSSFFLGNFRHLLYSNVESCWGGFVINMAPKSTAQLLFLPRDTNIKKYSCVLAGLSSARQATVKLKMKRKKEYWIVTDDEDNCTWFQHLRPMWLADLLIKRTWRATLLSCLSQVCQLPCILEILASGQKIPVRLAHVQPNCGNQHLTEGEGLSCRRKYGRSLLQHWTCPPLLMGSGLFDNCALFVA